MKTVKIENCFAVNIHKCINTRLLYERDLPPFGYIIVIVVFLILLNSFIWANVTKKTDVIINNGIIESANKNYIVNPYSGKIKKAFVKEGEKVKTGSLLFIIKSFDKSLQKEQLDVQKKELENSLPKYYKEIRQYGKLKKSITDGENYFSSKENDSYYYHAYETYRRQIEQETLTKKALKEAGFKNSQIESELEKNKIYLEEIYHSKMAEIDSKINDRKMEINTITSQIKGLETADNEYRITAPNEGIIHLNYECKKGDVVNYGETIASISDSTKEYYVKTRISPKDRVKINVGDPVEMEVEGMIQSVYGTISGTVISIGNDITVNKDGNNNLVEYYDVKIKINDRELINSTGEVFPIIKGMNVETRIKYDKITYLDYLKEELGFKEKAK